jgi:hypothetical protein
MDFSIISERFHPLKTKLLTIQDEQKVYEFAFCFSFFNEQSNQFVDHQPDYWLFFESNTDFIKFLQFELPIYMLNNLDYQVGPSEDGENEFEQIDIQLVKNLLHNHFNDLDSYFSFSQKQEQLIKLGFEIGFSALIQFYQELSSETNTNIYGQLKPKWMGSIKQLETSTSQFENNIVRQFADMASADSLLKNLILFNKLNIYFDNFHVYNSMTLETMMDMSEDEKEDFKEYLSNQLDLLDDFLKQTNCVFIIDKYTALSNTTKSNFLI